MSKPLGSATVVSFAMLFYTLIKFYPLLLSATNGDGQGYLQCLTGDLKYTKCRIRKRNRVSNANRPLG